MIPTEGTILPFSKIHTSVLQDRLLTSDNTCELIRFYFLYIRKPGAFRRVTEENWFSKICLNFKWKLGIIPKRNLFWVQLRILYYGFTESWSLHETLWAIWCYSYNLKNVKNNHGGVLLLVKFSNKKLFPKTWPRRYVERM